jgi:hypothetical protein
LRAMAAFGSCIAATASNAATRPAVVIIIGRIVHSPEPGFFLKLLSIDPTRSRRVGLGRERTNLCLKAKSAA